MVRASLFFISVGVFAAFAFASGCSSPSPSSSTPTATVSFSNDVLGPIFQASCSNGGITCHGDPSVVMATDQMRPYLGPPTGQASAAAIIAGLEKPSNEDPSMPLVTPGNSTQSYLMQKMDNTMGTLDCSKGDDLGTCGLAMPYNVSGGLPQSVRDVVRTWINEGAQNN